MSKISVLFVCLGNICRSPMAEGTFTSLVEQQGTADRFRIDSAGTGDWHVGKSPDNRAMATAATRGIDISHLRARQVKVADFEAFDHILAMDMENHMNLHAMAPEQHKHKIRMFLEFAPEYPEQEVPDPYYGGQQGFDHVLDLVQAASQGLHTELLKQE